MQESPVDIPCPICSIAGEVYMIAHIDEIPYFGEHTQVTVMCHSCGWVAECSRCDARFTYHMKKNLLQCHHCDKTELKGATFWKPPNIRKLPDVTKNSLRYSKSLQKVALRTTASHLIKASSPPLIAQRYSEKEK